MTRVSTKDIGVCEGCCPYRSKGKGKIHPRTGHEGPWVEQRYSPILSLASALDGGHSPPALPPGQTRYPLYRRLRGPQGRSGWVRKILPPRGIDPRTFQPVASRYTDRAIAARSYSSTAGKNWHCVWYMIISLAPIHYLCALTSSAFVSTTAVVITKSVDAECLKCSKLYTLHLLFRIFSSYRANHNARSSYTMYTGKSSSFCIFLPYPP
jgi:hypothetical protein